MMETREFPYIDLHCDTVLNLLEKEQQGKPVSLQDNDLHIDLQKMKQGGCLLQTFALFTDRKLLPIPEQQAIRLYDIYARVLEENREWLGPVSSLADIEKNRKEGKISALLSLEDGGVVFSDLAMLRTWYRLGVRMIALNWNFPNGIGHPNIRFEAGMDYKAADFLHMRDSQRGLTDFGIQYVQEMERLGMLVDVSHLSDAGFWDVMRITHSPVIASHSNAAGVCPVGRNLTDEMILAIARRGGIIGMNFCADFLRENSGNQMLLLDVVRHMKYIKELAGIDCLALGSDFDGIHSHLELGDASGMQQLARTMLQEGFSEEEVEKVFSGNALRVFRQVLS